MTYKLRSRCSTSASEERKLSTYERLNIPVAPLMATSSSLHLVQVSLLGTPKPRLNSAGVKNPPVGVLALLPP